MVVLAEAFGSWLLGQFFDTVRRRLGEQLLGGGHDRALLAAGQAAVARTARELRPDGSEEDVEHLEAVLDQVFRASPPVAPLEKQPTILHALERGIAAQLTVLGDATLTGTGESSAETLGLSVERITETLIRNIIKEILARGVGGGPLTPLADQLNHDVTHLQAQHTASMLSRIAEELARMTRQAATIAHRVPRELPRPIADFTGRNAELTILHNQLASGASESSTSLTAGQPVVISAIDGMGGTGKSALAIQVAHELVDAGAYPDGQLYVNLQGATAGLAPLEPLEALGRMLRALGAQPAQIPADVEESAARFRTLAAEHRLLVVLDNAASPEQVRPLLPASPTCGVVITSRQVLASLEGTRLLHLDILPPDQALELLVRIAGPDRIAPDRGAGGDVVRLCGYLPLAIRIAGARLVARPGWKPRVLATRLADATSRLEELQTGELAVRASFNVSLEALKQSPDPSDRAAVGAFGLLSLPDGPDLGVAAAAQLLNRPEDGTQRLLERLVDAKLLESRRPDRYHFHDLVRLYAREHAESQHLEPERLAALTRMLSFYVDTAWHTLALLRPGDYRLVTVDPRWIGEGIRFPDVSAALAWLEGERANLLAAVSQAATAAAGISHELACQLPQALYGFFEVRGYWQDGIQANQIALELARGTRDLAGQARAYNDLGNFHQRLGRYAEAIACHQNSLTLFRKLGDRQGEAYSLTNLGLAFERQGRYAEAVAYQQDSLTIWRELGHPYGEGHSLNNLGVVYLQLGQYGEAIASQRDSITLFRKLGDRHREAESLRDLGDALRAAGRDLQARTALQEALAICEALHIPEADRIRARLATLPSETAEPPASEQSAGLP